MKSKILLAVALSLSFASAYAQHEERVLNSEPIDVDGYLAEKQVTDHELEQIRSEIRKQKGEVVLNKEKSKGFKELSKTTEKLSEVTEEYIDEKKDAQKEIAEYNAKIKCLMEENPGRDCDKYIKNKKEEKEEVIVQEVVVAQAAPSPIATSMGEINTSGDLDRPWEEIKLIPVAGTTHYAGDKESLDATFAAGLRLESNINTRFSLGMGFNYAKLSTQDFANNNYTSYTGGGYYGNGGYGSQGRDINFQTMGVELYGKFFITRGERFRPYVGGGVGYNQASMNYTQNNPYQYNQYNFGNEDYKTSYATGRLMAGTEIMISRGFGLMIEAGYMTGMGGGSGQNSKNVYTNPDQKRLQELGKDIINASAITILGGAVVVF
jgi:chaperonin cofactor prefoldin